MIVFKLMKDKSYCNDLLNWKKSLPINWGFRDRDLASTASLKKQTNSAILKQTLPKSKIFLFK